MADYVDRLGKEIHVGSKVIYTTNARDSGLNYGIVLDLYEANSYRVPIKKVKVRALDDDGNQLHEQETVWNVPGDYKQGYTMVPMERLVRASTIDYGSHKFLVLE